MPFTFGSTNPVEIVAWGKPHTRPFLLLAGTNYVAGTVMGVVTSSGKAVAYSKTATDGSQFPVGILFDNINLTATGPYGSVDWNASVAIGGPVAFFTNLLTGLDLFAERFLGRNQPNAGPGGEFMLGFNGSASHLKFIRTTVADVAYQAVPVDEIVAYTTLTAARICTLPAVASMTVGAVIIVKDEAGTAGTNNLTVKGSGSENIDGANTKVISANYGSVRLYNTGAAWFTF